MGPLAEAQRRNQLSRMKVDAASVRANFEHARKEYFANSTQLTPMVLWKSAPGNLVGFDSSIEYTQCLGSQVGLISPISFKISTTRSDPEKGGDEPLPRFDLPYEVRRAPEGPPAAPPLI